MDGRWKSCGKFEGNSGKCCRWKERGSEVMKIDRIVDGNVDGGKDGMKSAKQAEIKRTAK